jgi:hypothetical protein
MVAAALFVNLRGASKHAASKRGRLAHVDHSELLAQRTTERVPLRNGLKGRSSKRRAPGQRPTFRAAAGVEDEVARASRAGGTDQTLPVVSTDDRVFWAGDRRVVVGPAVLEPRAIATWSE